MSGTQAQEAARLAALLDAEQVRTVDVDVMHSQAAALIRSQAARIAELERELADLHTTMFAAAVEIQEHWDAHCDAEGYGPANLMHRLERGIASQYGYDAKTLQRVEAERDALRAELARMREPLSDEQIDALRVESAKAMQSLADRGLIPAPEVCDEDLVRRVEAAHGITKTGGGA